MSTPIITDVRWHAYRVPLRQPMSTAHGLLEAREGAIIELVTDAGVTGIGEVVSVPEFGGQHLRQMHDFFIGLADVAHGQTLKSIFEEVTTAAIQRRQPAPVFAGMEMAILDALGKLQPCTVAELLTAHGVTPRVSVAVNATIAVRHTNAAIAAALAAIADGFTCIKLKVGIEAYPEDEIARILALRTAIGPAVQLRLDANEGWDATRAIAIMTACQAADIQYIEQPLPRDQVVEMAQLRGAGLVPIAADEAASDGAAIDHLINAQAADIYILKPSLMGGLFATELMMQRVASNGRLSVITSAIETGVGVAAALHLAAATGRVELACGLATLSLLEDDLLIDSLPIAFGHMAVPTGPGLGVSVDWDALARYEEHA